VSAEYERERKRRESEENPLAGPDDKRADRRFKKPRRAPTQWEAQWDGWEPSKHHFDCCGTRYGAPRAEQLETIKLVHRRLRHA